MSKRMKILLAALAVEVILGGAFLAWIFLGVNFSPSKTKVSDSAQKPAVKPIDLGEADLKSVEGDLTFDIDNDKDLAELDKLMKEIDNIDLKGI